MKRSLKLFRNNNIYVKQLLTSPKNVKISHLIFFKKCFIFYFFYLKVESTIYGPSQWTKLLFEHNRDWFLHYQVQISWNKLIKKINLPKHLTQQFITHYSYCPKSWCDPCRLRCWLCRSTDPWQTPLRQAALSPPAWLSSWSTGLGSPRYKSQSTTLAPGTCTTTDLVSSLRLNSIGFLNFIVK